MYPPHLHTRRAAFASAPALEVIACLSARTAITRKINFIYYCFQNLSWEITLFLILSLMIVFARFRKVLKIDGMLMKLLLFGCSGKASYKKAL
jgi:hypothetical protein